MENYNIIMSDIMPIGIKGNVIKNHDDSYTIMINAKYDAETQRKTLEHELYHISNEDFYRSNVEEIEREAEEVSKTAEWVRQYHKVKR